MASAAYSEQLGRYRHPGQLIGAHEGEEGPGGRRASGDNRAGRRPVVVLESAVYQGIRVGAAVDPTHLPIRSEDRLVALSIA